MTFRIRPRAFIDPAEDVSSREARDSAYASFLATRGQKIPTVLWRHFRGDFFHDGEIEAIDHVRPHEIRLRVGCPNIRHHTGNDFQFVNADFDVTFFGVLRFMIEQDPESEGEPGRPRWTYSSSEIDTALPPEKGPSRADDPGPNSLIIDADSCWMTIVFDGMSVDAVEPVAFALMCADPQFEIPWAADPIRTS